MAEVGVRDGRTTFHLLDQNLELVIYAVDKSISGFYNNDIKAKYGNRLIPIEALSVDGANSIPNAHLDLVFIDADHSYEWVKKDIAAYKPKLKTGGWLTGPVSMIGNAVSDPVLPFTSPFVNAST